MTPAEFRAALDTIGWSMRELARRLVCDEKQVRRWVTGEYPVPEELARWLARMAAYHERNPRPDVPELRTIYLSSRLQKPLDTEQHSPHIADIHGGTLNARTDEHESGHTVGPRVASAS